MPRPKHQCPYRRGGKSAVRCLCVDERLTDWLREQVSVLLPADGTGVDAAAEAAAALVTHIIGDTLAPILREAVADRKRTRLQKIMLGFLPKKSLLPQELRFCLIIKHADVDYVKIDSVPCSCDDLAGGSGGGST